MGSTPKKGPGAPRDQPRQPRQRAASATLAHARDAAESLLLKGNAVDAVVAGVFAAAATQPTVLLGPVQLLFGGGGAGMRALSGRCRQPGLGADRPRGFREGDPIPEAARVSVPGLPAGLVAALAAGGDASLAQVMGPAVELAKGSPRRAVLQSLLARGAVAMSEGAILSELLQAANRVAGGILTRQDLEDMLPESDACIVHKVDARGIFSVPWGSGAVFPGSTDEGPDARWVHSVLAVDRRGLFAMACFEEPMDALSLPELGLGAPLLATPVRRGEPRVKPGTAIGAAFPGAMVERSGAVDIALSVAGSVRGEAEVRGLLARVLSDEPVGAATSGRLLGITATRSAAATLG